MTLCYQKNQNRYKA